eukprot:3150972-Prymnesium_polylepis.1
MDQGLVSDTTPHTCPSMPLKRRAAGPTRRCAARVSKRILLVHVGKSKAEAAEKDGDDSLEARDRP